MATLCFGGSFNPIHHGHLICARAAAEQAGYDRVTFIPSGRPPHKLNVSHIADPEHRLAMCRLAISDSTGLGISDLEVKSSDPSYTITTARTLKKQGWTQVDWLIGVDMLNYLPQWHEPEALLREVRFVVMARPGWIFAWDALPEPYQVLRERVVSVPQIDLSATEIRSRVAAARSIDFLTPPAVVDYIRHHGLYRGE